MMHLEFKPQAGETIHSAASKMVAISHARRLGVRGRFNSVELVVTPESTVDDICNTYWRKMKERHLQELAAEQRETVARVKRKIDSVLEDWPGIVDRSALCGELVAALIPYVHSGGSG